MLPMLAESEKECTRNGGILCESQSQLFLLFSFISYVNRKPTQRRDNASSQTSFFFVVNEIS